MEYKHGVVETQT